MSQEGATHIRQQLDKIVDCPFIILMVDEQGKGCHILANRMDSQQAEHLLKHMASRPFNPSFET